ncbi:PAS domain-containing protein [Neoehrlichia mikurensis]|uniref:PAS domain-containing protein n=1 Tax=Neoehrlichia mikurensis TaxID=89586 RepID=A0A9Q9BSM2_9RICK|nr:PAS domain-containing protein [Neoehrlichia mikurensis]QXK91756.1 PAS domain-containing protein [Neoehrlichia mikurensis]QXK92968.1 PAS domain-containing protein [Neoehrlichia mikurensis]QXK93446.1 PAS domain-containing protein [Neoehrlichia mikurensis]UTO55600.1 PAS domain-containing protein [Neoehrlichia mikurensis]UTO56521.1 PAS domain-containing protein [Neoehrlichia mikurensis]
MSDYVPERRAIKILYEYWNTLRNTRNFPQKSEIDPDEIIEAWPSCFIIDIQENVSHKYHCSYIGEKAINLYKSDVRYYSTSEHITMFFPQVIEDLEDYLESVIENHTPIIKELETQLKTGHYLKIRQCLLPLGKQNTVNAIIGVVGGKIY